MTSDPGTYCAPVPTVLSVTPGSDVGCSAPTCQWQQDGVDVPGAVDPTYVVPTAPVGSFDYRFVLSCPEPLPCGDTSPSVRVDVPALVSVLDDSDITGWMRVRKPFPDRDLDLSWDDAGVDATACHVTQGTIGSWYSHAALACALPRVPAGATSQQARIARPPFQAYFLLAPADCLGEGRVGSDSFGTRRPRVGSGAPCGAAP